MGEIETLQPGDQVYIYTQFDDTYTLGIVSEITEKEKRIVVETQLGTITFDQNGWFHSGQPVLRYNKKLLLPTDDAMVERYRRDLLAFLTKPIENDIAVQIVKSLYTTYIACEPSLHAVGPTN